MLRRILPALFGLAVMGAVLGIAVLNGLVMVSYFRQLREEGLPLAQAVRSGGCARC